MHQSFRLFHRLPSCLIAQLFVLTTLGLSSQCLVAEPIPDAGQLLQQIEKERAPTPPKTISPPIAPTAPLTKPAGGASVTVKLFQFAGNTLIKSDALALVVTPYLNRPLTFAELQNVAADVAETYRKAGWVVRAYLPKQDITNGTVAIQIIEAVFGGTRIKADPTARINPEYAQGIVEAAQAVGTPLNGDKLDRALLLLNDMPGVTASGTMAEGKQQSQTDLVLKLANEKLITGEIGVDNIGSRATGGERVTANAYINSPFKIGDQLAANYIHSEGNDYLRMAYSLPVDNDGWRVGASGSYLLYDLVADNFKSLDANGNSSNVGLNASYPLIRSRLKNLFLGLNFDHKDFDNKANQATTRQYQIDNLYASLNGNLFDRIAGGGTNSAGLTLTGGKLNLGHLNLSESQAVDGLFVKLNYYLSRQQVITEKVSVYVSLSGQEADKHLDSAEKFYLGGAYGVRAYPANEASGSGGQLFNLELRNRLPYNFVVTAFYDLGHVHDTETKPNSYIIQGSGLSVAWTANFGLNIKATWAHRIGNNPNANPINGTDQDGSLNTNRFWLQSTMSF